MHKEINTQLMMKQLIIGLLKFTHNKTSYEKPCYRRESSAMLL